MKRARIVLAVVTAACGAVALAACILADPPPLETIPLPMAPQIQTDSVSPPLSAWITSAPSQSLTFSVPVLTDPNGPLQWRVFVDVDPNQSPSGGGLVLVGGDDGGVVATSPDASTLAIVPIDFTLTSQLDFSSCHTITIVVAQSFQQNSGTPEPPGGSQATWFYVPGNCSFSDAAPPFDASALADGADE